MSSVEAQALIARIRAQREFWVDVAPGKRLRVRRPVETDFVRYSRLSVGLCAACVVGWDGFSEADLLGAAIGSSDPLPFDEEACLEVVLDRAEWASVLAIAIAKAIKDHLDAKDAAGKN